MSNPDKEYDVYLKDTHAHANAHTRIWSEIHNSRLVVPVPPITTLKKLTNVIADYNVTL